MFNTFYDAMLIKYVYIKLIKKKLKNLNVWKVYIVSLFNIYNEVNEKYFYFVD